MKLEKRDIGKEIWFMTDYNEVCYGKIKGFDFYCDSSVALIQSHVGKKYFVFFSDIFPTEKEALIKLNKQLKKKIEANTERIKKL